jgi:hypothetical protein
MKMKKHLLTLCLIIPFIGFSQKVDWIEKERFSLQLKVGTTYDHYSNNFDLQNPDLSSNYTNDLKFNSVANVYYKLIPTLSLGLGVGQGEIYGENNSLYYEGEFEELNFDAKLNILSYKDIILYGEASTGLIRYQSERFLKSNDALEIKTKGEALKSSIALGLEYEFKDRLSVLFDARFNRVNDDNFDGRNDNLGNSKYFVTSVGIKYDLGNISNSKEKEPTYNDKEELDGKVEEYHKNNVEPRLDKLEKEINNHSHQADNNNVVVEKAEPKLNHYFFYDTNKNLVSINSLERVINIADF